VVPWLARAGEDKDGVRRTWTTQSHGRWKPGVATTAGWNYECDNGLWAAAPLETAPGVHWGFSPVGLGPDGLGPV
jgi:hypothetical protein